MATYSPQCSRPSKAQTMKKEITAISTADRLVPRLNAFSKVRWSAFSSVRTKNVPMTEQIMPTAAIAMGIAMALNAWSANAATPSAEAEMMEPT